MTAATGSSRRSGSAWIGAAALVIAVVLVVVLTGRQPAGSPFDVRSATPSGYKALAVLLGERGADVRRTSADEARLDPPGPGDVLVVPDPDLLTDPEAEAYRAAADAGAVVVFGTERTSSGDLGESDPFGGSGVFPVDDRTLADTPADAVGPGTCDIEELSGLAAVDAAFADPIRVAGVPSCYGDHSQALVRREPTGRGVLITLGSPYLWVNARLQPDKEDGGLPLDNAAMALRLLGPTVDGATTGTRITFVDAVPSAGVTRDGRRSPLSLLPLGVRLALVQLVAAFVVYAWWRARRLGRPVSERIPVPIAGSELVAAVGDLLRRRGSADRAAAVLRADARRQLARRLGVPPDASPGALVTLVAARTGRDAEQVADALLDRPVGSADELIRLTNTIDAIRQEVLHGHPVA